MKWLTWAKEHWKRLIAGSLSLLTIAGAFAILQPTLAANTSGNGVVYKEEKVSFGDLTVGITESGSASLQSKTITYPVNVEIKEVYVKAGQRVTAGESLFLVDVQALADEYNTLKNSYDSAVLKLEEATLAQQTGAISAKYDYDSTLLNGETADAQYNYTIAELAVNIANQEEKVEKLGDELDDLSSQRSALRTERNAASSAYNSAAAAYNAALAADPNDPGLPGLKAAMDSAKQLYNDLSKEYDKVSEEYSDTSASLTTAALKLSQLENQMEVGVLQAEADKEKSVLESGSATEIYNATIQQLATAVSSARATVNSIQKEMAQVSPYIGDGVIKASVDGLIVSVDCAAGDSVNAKSSLGVQATNTVYVVVSVSQTDIADLELGQEVQLSFDAYSGEIYKGTVDSISYSAARMGSSSVSYSVTVLVDGNPKNIFEGMTCDATFITRQETDVLFVSNRAVTTNEDGSQTVLIPDQNGNPVKQSVTTGFSDGRYVEILSGLEAGQTVLIESQVNS